MKLSVLFVFAMTTLVGCNVDDVSHRFSTVDDEYATLMELIASRIGSASIIECVISDLKGRHALEHLRGLDDLSSLERSDILSQWVERARIACSYDQAAIELRLSRCRFLGSFVVSMCNFVFVRYYA